MDFQALLSIETLFEKFETGHELLHWPRMPDSLFTKMLNQLREDRANVAAVGDTVDTSVNESQADELIRTDTSPPLLPSLARSEELAAGRLRSPPPPLQLSQAESVGRLTS